MKELCRVCASELRGTQRRWIFGSGSPLDLRAILSHVLGRDVRRGDGRGEFVCGKCASSLERVYRYDGVIARVQALSLQKMRSLLGQRDTLCQCLRYLHARSQPEEAADPPGPEYEALLQRDMALSAYECWSEGSVSRMCTCPGRVCSGCSALRVSEAVYESVCGFPRSLAYAQLSRDKSRSVPLALGSPEETAGRWRGKADGPPLSDGGWPRSRSLSASSLGPPPSSGPYSDEEELEVEEREDRSPVLSATLELLRGIVYRPVPVTPRHSRIPILTRRDTAAALGGWETPGERLTEEPLPDVDKDFSSEYLPFDLQKFLEHGPARDGTQQRVVELCEQLEVARQRIQTLERQLHGPVSSNQEMPTQSKHGQETYSQCRMIKWLTAELHSKEQLFQRSLELLVQLLSGTSPAADVKADLVEKLRARLKERDEQLQRDAEERFAAVEEVVAAAEGLRRAVRQKDQDLRRLGEVVTRNEEMIHMLSCTLKVKDTAVEQLEAQCKSLKEVGSKRDKERVASLREKDRIISQLRVTLNNSIKDVEALTDSVLSRGLSRGSQSDSDPEPGSVALRLKEKDNLLVQVLVDQERQAARHQQTTEDLLDCVMERDRVIQELSKSHREAAADKAEKLRALQAQLSARDRELAERRGLRSAAAQECFSELAAMRALLEHKDQLILDLLEGGRERDQLLSCLQQHVAEGALLKVCMKHTL